MARPSTISPSSRSVTVGMCGPCCSIAAITTATAACSLGSAAISSVVRKGR
jgi:hypothetical protein